LVELDNGDKKVFSNKIDTTIFKLKDDVERIQAGLKPGKKYRLTINCNWMKEPTNNVVDFAPLEETK
jgi:hypothetical protein